MQDGDARAPLISWLVVSHDDEPHLRRLLPALSELRAAHAAAGCLGELIVADNASRDGSAATARRLAPDATVLALPANVGYGSALNAAAGLSRGRWLACLNADVLPDRAGFAALPALLAAAPGRCAVLGPALFDATGRSQPSVGRWPTLAGLLLGLLRPRRHRRVRAASRRLRGEVPWVSAACLFLRAEALAAVGGFSPEYFVYYTEVDLARRLHAAGWHVRFEPALAVAHLAPLHGRPRDAATAAHVRDARLAYFRNHRPGWEAAVLARLQRLEPWLRRERPAGGPALTRDAGGGR